MKTELFFTSNGEVDIRLNEGFSKGKKTLLANGFVPCENEKYMVKDFGEKQVYVHFNSLLKNWLFQIL